ncbi:SET domain-containing protein-lysine N-methyltransferase [Niallia oryzisoli]|uniref:SET domain-containing protein-lysine N-methyltransferase n=1 Tax=Niallia oryzisoli TaxID=1737571 RepID=A0ABZ2CJ23_9BACI
MIIIPKVEWQLMSECVLVNYIFRWNEDKALALGYGSLYNHSYTPNVGYFTNIENQSIDFYVMKDIREGKELMVNYIGDPEDQSPLWFEVIE